MSIVSGIEELKKRMEEAKKARETAQAGDAMKQMQLELKDGDIAMIRFWTEAKDIRTAMFHAIKVLTKNGKEFTEEHLCLAPEPCKLDVDENKDNRRIKPKMFLWTYAFHVLHKNQSQPTWVKVERAGMIFYKEEINAPKFLKSGEGKDGYIVNKFLNFFYKYGTLCDRSYEWIRQGASLDTQYELLPEDPSSISDTVRAAMAATPSLDSIIKGEVATIKPADKPVELPLLERLKQAKEKGLK